MTPLVFLVALVFGHVSAGVVELSCSDNATCIDHMLKEAARSLRQQKSVRLFDSLTIEPLKVRRGRSNDSPLARFTKNNAFSFDWNDYTFRVTRPQDKSDVLDLEVYESRSAKDVSDPNPKKSSSKVEEDKESDKGPQNKLGLRRRQKKKIAQAVIPLLFGMKSAAVVIFAMGIVTVLTLKAFVASKAALLVTVGMAVKKLYESYSSGAGLGHPYLYSQYPIDFPSASSHAYSVSGVSPQFASPELYNPTALGNQQAHELLQQADASAQQSQQAPTLQLVNSTRAAERWDGKSKLRKLLEPVLESIRSFVDPIANVFYSMPATFRGLNSEVSTTETKSYEPEPQESVTQAKVILVPQPRLIAQRKTTYRKPYRQGPKKYAELKINLENLKQNKDLYDYLKTKKYKYNYPHTFYYPKVKYFVNPSYFMTKPNNSRLKPYKKEARTSTLSSNIITNKPLIKPTVLNTTTEWKPIIVLSEHPVLSISNNNGKRSNLSNTNAHIRVKREMFDNSYRFSYRNSTHRTPNDSERGFLGSGKGIFDIFQSFFSSDAMYSLVKHAQNYAKSVIKSSLKSKEPPTYYKIVYDILVMSLDMFDGFLGVEEQLHDHVMSKNVEKTKVVSKIKKIKKKSIKSKRVRELNAVPETSNVLWNLARYFRVLFGLPPSPLTAPSMTMPMYVLPQMYSEPMAMPTMPPTQT
ncbi:hypothetical protein ACJJTC_014099 [Scirpophaga incertulas]